MTKLTGSYIASKLAEKSWAFRSRGEYKPAELRAVFDAHPGQEDWSFQHRYSTKVRWGVYRYNAWSASGVVVEQAPVTAQSPAMVAPKKVELDRRADAKDPSFTIVPKKDAEFVPFGDYKDIETIVKSGVFYPILITGHSGNGKTIQVEQACARAGRPMIRINCTRRTDDEVLIGSKTLEDGNVLIQEGPLLIAMRSGALVLLDEFSCSDPGAIMCIQGIMEGKPYYFALTGEIITPVKGFNIVMTDNTKGQGSDDGRYVGTNILNEAFLERIAATYEHDFPPINIETKILQKKMQARGLQSTGDAAFCAALVKWADSTRKTFKAGGVDSVISTRRLGQIIENYHIFGDHKKAIVQCTNRFPDATKNAFVKLWQSYDAKGFKDMTQLPQESQEEITVEDKDELPF